RLYREFLRNTSQGPAVGGIDTATALVVRAAYSLLGAQDLEDDGIYVLLHPLYGINPFRTLDACLHEPGSGIHPTLKRSQQVRQGSRLSRRIEQSTKVSGENLRDAACAGCGHWGSRQHGFDNDASGWFRIYRCVDDDVRCAHQARHVRSVT